MGLVVFANSWLIHFSPLQGMVDAGENVSITLKREFSEEALNTLEATPEERKRIEASVTDLFRKGTEVRKEL